MVNSQEELNAKMEKIGYIQTTATSKIVEMGATLTMTTFRGKPKKKRDVQYK